MKTKGEVFCLFLRQNPGMEKIISLDKQLFQLINGEWHAPFWDVTLTLLRTSQTNYVLYLFLIVFVLMNAGRNKIWWLVFAALTATLTDFVSSDLIKENIWRLRPCRDETLQPAARFILNYCPRSSSFTSSHAVNHFGLAAFFMGTLKPYLGRWSVLFMVWAAAVAYAQVYVGVHFPLDVTAGAAIGWIFGYLSARSFNKHYGLS